ncbi:hypothetical protein [Nocardia sp. NBC_00416]|uniref:hypothetical protein n=1 Tax=Nocardia sp. NBC_00416 TaxID=2975991 RepID=UPI002E203BFC
MADGFVPSESCDDLPVSTPLHRAAGRLQSALPDGWQVEVVDAAESGSDAQPVLRALLATD